MRFERHIQQSMRRHAEIGVAALHDNGDPGNLRTALAHDIDDLTHRQARGNDVFDDECAVSGVSMKLRRSVATPFSFSTKIASVPSWRATS